VGAVGGVRVWVSVGAWCGWCVGDVWVVGGVV